MKQHDYQKAFIDWFYDILLSKANLDANTRSDQIEESLVYFVTINLNSNTPDIRMVETYFDRLCQMIFPGGKYTHTQIQKKPFMISFRDRFGTRTHYTPDKSERGGIVHYHCVLLLNPHTKIRFENYLKNKLQAHGRNFIDSRHGMSSIKQVYISPLSSEIGSIKRLISYSAKFQTRTFENDNYRDEDICCFPRYSERKQYFFYSRNKTAKALSSKGYPKMRWKEIVGKSEKKKGKKDEEVTVESSLEETAVGAPATASALQTANANLKSAKIAKKLALAKKKNDEAIKLRQDANKMK